MTVFGAYTSAGSVKATNQDAACFRMAQDASATRLTLAVVCDGVGGFSEGELASSTVVSRIAIWFGSFSRKMLGESCRTVERQTTCLRSCEAEWEQLLASANADIYAYGKANGASLGTTFTAMLVYGSCWMIAHVGDSRVYEVNGRSCNQLTVDQTLVAQKIARGELTAEQARTYPKRNVILQAVGTQKTLKPVFGHGDFTHGATYVVCSDGFYRKMPDEELVARFGIAYKAEIPCLSSCCEHAAEDVMERGEKDNITVVAFTDFGDDEKCPSENPAVNTRVDARDDVFDDDDTTMSLGCLSNGFVSLPAQQIIGEQGRIVS